MRTTRRCSWLLVLVGAALLTGCAVGNRYAYHTVALEPRISGTGQVSVATLDQREYVVSGNKNPRFVGLQRGGYGNPFDVRTRDDRPLADNMTAAIAAALTSRGFQAIPVFVAAAADAAAARRELLQRDADRSLLLTLREWKSDTYVGVALLYDVTLVVMDRTGQSLAEKRLQGRDDLGANFWNPPSRAKREVPRAFKAKLEELLSDPAITGALR